ncbi:hypothetical protein L226DRAFT_425663, partial [Lentinus tigrinus ALCF2SS1-7]|uniref:uncharacterized protein n=1 Tax=Lentinus tigrinus ALCF2SS1-7 TaxID=1328758 RepID=UPI001165C916
IPVVVYDGAREQLSVRRSSEGPYVAISHVWADGLGSVTQRGLPACQIERLSALIVQLEPRGAFWMDSLCIPRGHYRPVNLRKLAIKLMARTYKEAASVLVIDTGIQTQCSTSSTVSNYLFRISLSGWMHRVWTLQEGLLARRLYFEFGGGAIVDVEKILAIHKGVIQLSLPVSDAFLSAYIPRGFISPEETERLVSLFGYRRRALSSGISTTLEDAIVLLHNRSTSHEEDETIAIAGLFPGKVNVEALLDIKDSSSSATSLRRMEAFLIQLGEVPKELPWLPLSVDRLHRLNFRWAPATLTSVGSSFSGATFFRTASCTADGLRGKYVVGRLPTAILIP